MKKLWLENDERIKEKLAELKEELEKERMLQIQQHYVDSLRQMKEERADLKLKADQLALNRMDHEKVREPILSQIVFPFFET